MTEAPTHLVRESFQNLPSYKAGVSPGLLKAVASGKPVARLGSNENLYGTSPRVYEAIHSASDVNLYPDGGSTALREALAAHLRVDADRILVSTGSENVLRAVFQSVLNPGDRVVSVQPTFLLAEILSQASGAVHVGVPYEDDLEFRAEALAGAAEKDPKILYIANPNNPTGSAFSPDQLRTVLSRTPPETLVVLDEAYFEYAVHHEGFDSSLPVLEACGLPYVVLRTFSKAYGLAGLRVGYGIFYHPELVSLVLAGNTVFDVAAISQVAALAALDDQVHLNQTVAATLAEKKRVLAALDAAGQRTFPAFGNFVSLWFSDREDALDLERALSEHAVFVKALPARSREGLVRVTVGRPEDNDRFLEALGRLR